MEQLDRIDMSLLRMLQADGRQPVSRLAEAVSLSETPCWRRLKRLEDSGYILGYKALIDRRKAGFEIVVFTQLSVNVHTEEATLDFERRILCCPEVVMFHNISGDHDFLLMVIAKNLDSYSRFVESTLRKIPCIKSITSLMSLRDIKFSLDIPIT